MQADTYLESTEGGTKVQDEDAKEKMWEERGKIRKKTQTQQLSKISQPRTLAFSRLDLYSSTRSKSGSLLSEMEKNSIAA